MSFESTLQSATKTMLFSEIAKLAVDSFRSSKVRFALTALGMVIGTASLILVVTIGLTGKTYILNQIQAIGANLIYAEYESGPQRIGSGPLDPLTIDDMKAVQQQVSGITAATPVVNLNDRISVGEGRERDILVLGVNPQYRVIRNLVVEAGRFFDEQDQQARNKVTIVEKQLAQRLYGDPDAAIGHTIKLSGLSFTVVGVFREKVETFGQSEVTHDTILIPYTVRRYFTDGPAVKQIYFTVADTS